MNSNGSTYYKVFGSNRKGKEFDKMIGKVDHALKTFSDISDKDIVDMFNHAMKISIIVRKSSPDISNGYLPQTSTGRALLKNKSIIGKTHAFENIPGIKLNEIRNIAMNNGYSNFKEQYQQMVDKISNSLIDNPSECLENKNFITSEYKSNIYQELESKNTLRKDSTLIYDNEMRHYEQEIKQVQMEIN